MINSAKEERKEMRKKARLSAESFFDYQNYTEKIKSIFENSKERN